MDIQFTSTDYTPVSTSDRILDEIDQIKQSLKMIPYPIGSPIERMVKRVASVKIKLLKKKLKQCRSDEIHFY